MNNYIYNFESKIPPTPPRVRASESRTLIQGGYVECPKLIVILGATATGKSSWAIDLAKQFNGEIVNADSRQVYSDMPIGSALVAGEFKDGVYSSGGVPHHLVSFRSPNDKLTLSEYRQLAIDKIFEIIARGRQPFLVGGTGLYINAVVQNFSIPAVAPDLKLRGALEAQSTAQLYLELSNKDPDYAAKINSQNRRYMIRALEVLAITGQRFSTLQQKNEPLFEVLELGIEVQREVLYQNIETRFDQQLAAGLVAETRLLGEGYNWEQSVLIGLGHRELAMFLKGMVTFKEAVDLAKKNIRHYAKRQLTWFKRDHHIHWCSEFKIAEKLVAEFLKT